MHAQALIALAAAFCLGFVAASSDLDGFEGYEISEASWEFAITEGQPPVVLNGTIQTVIAKLEENYPDFATQVLEGIEAVEEHHSINEDSQFLEKRQHFNKCFNQPQSASTAPIDQGIKYLRGVPGRPVLGPGNGPGKGRCVIPSCSYKSAILWCNDNTHTVRLDSYDAIANAARVITNACTRVYSGQSVTNGQRFHGNKQNVVVRGQDCPN